MIDQRALEAASQAVSSTPNDSGDGFMFHDPGDAWKVTWRAIEAYESAKPSLWSPIDAYDRENYDGNWILVHKDQRMPGSYDLMFWDETHEWCVAGSDRTYTHADLVERGAQFRTIDPPSPVSGSPAAEDSGNE